MIAVTILGSILAAIEFYLFELIKPTSGRP
jgi:hypothetical protein